MCARCKLRAKRSHNPTPVPPKKPYNAELSDERPPLHVAAGKGDVAAVRAMIQAGADINHATDNGMTPLLRAVHEGHDVVVRMLLKAGAELDNTLMDGFTPLYAAAAMGREACARMLIKAGVDIHKVSNDGVTPLFIAATRGHVAALRVLIEAGADINAVGEAGTTPLTFAIAQGNEAVVRALIEAGVDLNKSLDDGMFPPGQGVTPLHIAAQGGHQAIAHVLLEAGAVAPRHLWAILEAAGGTAAADVASKPDTPSPSGTSKVLQVRQPRRFLVVLLRPRVSKERLESSQEAFRDGRKRGGNLDGISSFGEGRKRERATQQRPGRRRGRVQCGRLQGVFQRDHFWYALRPC
jgi:ankyrin repeat protein